MLHDVSTGPPLINGDARRQLSSPSLSLKSWNTFWAAKMRTSLVLSFLAGVPVVVSEHPGQTTSNQNKIPETGGSDGVTNKYILELESVGVLICSHNSGS